MTDWISLQQWLLPSRHPLKRFPFQYVSQDRGLPEGIIGIALVFVFGKKTAWMPCSSSCNVYIKADGDWIGSGCTIRSEMGLAAVNGMVARLLQQGRQGCCQYGIVDTLHRAHAIVVPIRWNQYTVWIIGRRIPFYIGPIGNIVTGHIHARHQADTSGRADRIGICIGELHSSLGHPLHIGRMEYGVEGRGFVPERQGTILPTHIIHHEKNDVGLLLLSDDKRGACNKNKKLFVKMHEC